jgi:preprotein translocase subunit YajC
MTAIFPAALLQQGSSGNPVALFAPYVLIGLVFYFLLFLPMQRQKKKQQEMLNQLKSGDSVVTTGGITGAIVSVEADTVVLRVKPDNIKLQFARSAVQSVVTPESGKDAPK